MKKKILMLGGSHFQVPAIKYAKKAGYHVITADYLPNNPGHKYADEYYNVSTIDKKKVLELAKKIKIDGIVSYASDPGAPTAAYVSEKLNLPGNPYDSVVILQRKDFFKTFLIENGFNIPKYRSFIKIEKGIKYATELLKSYPIVVKPVDSSGSKGVTKLDSINHFNSAFNLAMNYSISKCVVIEQFINKSIYEMDGDGFVWNGKLAFRCFGNQHNDLKCNPHVPVGISFPYIQDKYLQQKAHNIVEKILTKLNMKVGGLNIEYLTDNDNNIYILEIGPRSGGNLIPEVIKYSTGIDLIKYSVDGALGKDCSDLGMIEPKGFYASYILHSQKEGVVKNIVISDEIKSHIVEYKILITKGDYVNKFNGSNDTLGTFILKFENKEQMINMMDRMNNYIYVAIK